MSDGEDPNKKREWLALASAWYRHSLRTAPHIMASTFHGESALVREFTSRTVAGLALWYYPAFAALWGNINPLVLLYTHRAPRVAGHSVHG